PPAWCPPTSTVPTTCRACTCSPRPWLPARWPSVHLPGADEVGRVKSRAESQDIPAMASATMLGLLLGRSRPALGTPFARFRARREIATSRGAHPCTSDAIGAVSKTLELTTRGFHHASL